MATYVIGDLQGCYEPFLRLLDAIRFDRTTDRLWLVGDLVNRGPDSLEVLRHLIELDDRVTAVLGNHDLHLLARHAGVSPPRRLDTLDEVLGATDASDLVRWLRTRPLLVQEGDWIMVHAGLAPSWTLEVAHVKARRLEARLRQGDVRLLGRGVPDDDPDLAAARDDLGIFTRLRMVDRRGRPDHDFKGAPGSCNLDLIPWFQARRHRIGTVLFGHWSTLGLHRGDGVVGLDTGCVWGGPLTAFRLEDGAIVQVPGARRPAPLDRD